MSIGFHIVNKNFLHQMEEYIKRKAEVEKENFSGIPENYKSKFSLSVPMDQSK